MGARNTQITHVEHDYRLEDSVNMTYIIYIYLTKSWTSKTRQDVNTLNIVKRAENEPRGRNAVWQHHGVVDCTIDLLVYDIVDHGQPSHCSCLKSFLFATLNAIGLALFFLIARQY